MHHPLYSKQGKNQLPQNACFNAMKEDVITLFFFFFTHVASVGKPPLPPSELIQDQNPGPSCLPSKEANSHRSPRIPNNAMRERCRSPIHQEGVIRFHREVTILWSQPHYSILRIQANGVFIQAPKKIIHHLQLPIMQLSNKPWVQLSLSQTSSIQASFEEVIE